jgi:phage terminase large subunit-like protein
MAFRWKSFRSRAQTAASQNLYDLILGVNLSLYPDAAMRLAVSRCVAVETPRGWRIAKEKAAHKIDVVVALAQAAYAAVQSQTDEDQYSYSLDAFDPNFTDLDDPRRGTERQSDPDREWQRARYAAYVMSGGSWTF